MWSLKPKMVVWCTATMYGNNDFSKFGGFWKLNFPIIQLWKILAHGMTHKCKARISYILGSWFWECPHPRTLPYTSELCVWLNRQVDEDKKGNTSKNVAWVVCQVSTSSAVWLWFQLLGKHAHVTAGTTCAYADNS